jgi:hypothetical protein
MRSHKGKGLGLVRSVYLQPYTYININMNINSNLLALVPSLFPMCLLRYINSILPYAPGELQMEPETEGCLYPCGGAI